MQFHFRVGGSVYDADWRLVAYVVRRREAEVLRWGPLRATFRNGLAATVPGGRGVLRGWAGRIGSSGGSDCRVAAGRGRQAGRPARSSGLTRFAG